jgi:hypothetical protein
MSNQFSNYRKAFTHEILETRMKFSSMPREDAGVPSLPVSLSFHAKTQQPTQAAVCMGWAPARLYPTAYPHA